MPIFRFQCKACAAESELLLPRYDSPAVCPECGSNEMKKLPGRIAAVLTPGARGCVSRHDCPTASEHHCCGNCCCGGGHQ